MTEHKKPNIVLMGGRQAGCIGLLTLLAAGYPVCLVVCNGRDTVALEKLADRLELPRMRSVNSLWVRKILADNGLLVSIHGLEIVDTETLGYWGGINIHPFPFAGLDPIGKLLESGQTTVFLRAHRMTSVVDGGDTLAEILVDVSGLKSRVEVYNKLYPYYSIVLLDSLEINESYLAETEMSEQLHERYRKEIEEMRNK